jgi:Ca2+-binding RTX toxin-like protein
MPTIIGTAGDDTLAGTPDSDYIHGKAGNDTIDGGASYDILVGGAGADTLNGGDGDDTIYAGEESGYWNIYNPPTLDTGSDRDTLNGGAGYDYIFAGYGDNVDGGADQDTLLISFLGGSAGITFDMHLTSQTIGGGLITNIEIATWVQGTNFDDFIDVSGQAPSATSGAVYGMGGNDQLIAGYYTNILDGGDGNDTLDARGSQYLQTLEGGAGNDTLYGPSNSVATASGGDGNDTIYASAGVSGGNGDDTIYYSSSYTNSFRVAGDAGNDRIEVNSQYGATVAGGDGSDTIYGNIGGDFLSSAAFGAYGQDLFADDVGTEKDVLEGLGGDDVLAIGYGDDADGGAGVDKLRLSLASAVSAISFNTASITSGQPFVLGGGTIQNIEAIEYIRATSFADTLTIGTQPSTATIYAGAGDDLVSGGGSVITVYGESGNDWINGSAAGDEIHGGAGADTIHAGGGNDAIYLDDISDLVAGETLDGGSGIDSLTAFGGQAGQTNYDLTGISLTGIEWLRTTNQARLVISTAQLADVTTIDANLVFADAGAVSFAGKAGSSSTIFIQLNAGGNQLDMSGFTPTGFMYTSVTGSGVSDTIIGSSANDQFTGGGGDDVLLGGSGQDSLQGGAGNDWLDGGTGSDTMDGGAGNDLYVVDSSFDTINESTSDAGIDTVQASVTYSLGFALENLTLTGSSAINGAGNFLDNRIVGNAGANALDGGNGNDTLTGGLGADTLTGGTGLDTFKDTVAGLNGDTVVDLQPGDRIVLTDATLSGFSASLANNVLTFTGGSINLVGQSSGQVVVSAAAEGGVQITVQSDPLFQAFGQFDLNAVNLNWYYAYGTATAFQPGVNATFNGQTYPDAFGVQAQQTFWWREMDFLGSGFVQNASGAITAGTVNVVGEFDLGPQTFLWYLQGASISAAALYNAALTASNSDELALIQAALSGDNTILMSPYADRMNGFAGNDTITGGAGADVLTGGGGDDTFRDTRAGLNGDTITDFGAGDRIILTDASLASFTYSVSGSTLFYTGGSLNLGSAPSGPLVASAALGGGVQLSVGVATPTQRPQNDFNGDGRSDILWRTWFGTIFDFLGTATGGVTNNGGNSSVDVPFYNKVAGIGDFNGDGRADILWRDSNSGAIFNFLGTATGGFTNNGDNSFVSAPSTTKVVGVADFNGDGRADILWRMADGTIFNFLGTANGGFTNNGGNSAVTVSTAYEVAGTGDFNGDGRADILWRNSSTGVIFNFLGTASGGFSNNGDNSYVAAGTGAAVTGVGDFNGDGRSDILWRTTTGTIFNFLGTAAGGYANNGGNSSVQVSTGYSVASVADFNGDGHSDILWTDASGVAFNFLGTASGGFINNGDNSYVRLDNMTTVQDPFL